MSRRSISRSGAVVRSLLNSLDSGARIRESLALAYWSRVVGPNVARASFAEEVRDGVLVVRTKGSAWSQEISLLKYRILPELNRLIGKPAIKDIRFLVSGVPEPVDEQRPPDFPSDDELAGVELAPDDVRRLAADLSELSAIPDPDFRATTARIVERQHRLRRWRLDRGWSICATCAASYEGSGESCPACRSEGAA